MRGRNIVGENNPRWAGGKFEYPHHPLMKRNRLIRLKEAGGKCEVCGQPAKQIHHIDGSKDNHELDNLAVLCLKCHGILHAGDGAKPRGRINTTNTIISRQYGLNLREMQERFGGTIARYYQMHRRGVLADFLNRATKEPTA